MKRESLQTPLLPDPFARLLGSECSLHCCSQTLQSQTPLLLSNAINHREGEKKWKREPPRPHAMQQQPMPMPAQAPPTAGITTEQIQKVPPLCPPHPPPSFSSGSWPRFGCAALASWEGFFGGQKI